MPWLITCLHSTECRTGALTVAGQWPNLTAFPSILAIVVVNLAARLGLDNRDDMELVSTS
jgi:hypothetical protein